MLTNWREAVSRSFTGLLSAGSFYLVYRCVVGAIAASGPDLVGRRVGLIVGAVLLGAIGLLLAVVTLVPVGLMERMYKPAPPITGDDGGFDRPRTTYAGFLVDLFTWW